MIEHGDADTPRHSNAEVTARAPKTIIRHPLPFTHPQPDVGLLVHGNSWNLLSPEMPRAHAEKQHPTALVGPSPDCPVAWGKLSLLKDPKGSGDWRQ